MPSLPRIRRTRTARGSGQVVARLAPLVHELSANGLTWVNVVAPDTETAQALAVRFGWHPLDVEDIVSKRQRPKVDDYEDDGYLFAVLHFPVFDQAVQRLNAAELDIFIGQDYVVDPEPRAPPGNEASSIVARTTSACASTSSRAARGDCSTRSSTTSSTTASRSSTRSRTSST